CLNRLRVEWRMGRGDRRFFGYRIKFSHNNLNVGLIYFPFFLSLRPVLGCDLLKVWKVTKIAKNERNVENM
ncbi:MAG: hypothetical protein ACKO6M_07850, partial [Bacteroidota bacterium]